MIHAEASFSKNPFDTRTPEIDYQEKEDRLMVWRYWCSYVKERWSHWMGTALLLGLFYSTAVLNQLPGIAQRMRYAFALTGFCWFFVTGVSFWHYYRKQEALRRVMQNPAESMEYLPPAEGLAESRYQMMMNRMSGEQKRLLSEQESRRQDMSDYYSMWAHQIKTPIAAMDLLLKREPGSVSGAMEEELFKIGQYVDMALHYVRLERISADLALQEQDIDELIRQAVRKSSVLFIGSGLSLEVQDTKIHAVTDEKWFTFLIEQLLSNAVKYTKKGGVRIYARSGEEIVVEDTGIGIPESDLPRIFERGFTGYNGRMHQKSTGIGLYLCRQAAAGLGIVIRAESDVGKGTRMMIRLPEGFS